MRLRVLPILIAFALLSLPLRLGGLWWAGDPQPARAQEAGQSSEEALKSSRTKKAATAPVDDGGEAMVMQGDEAMTTQAVPAFQRAGLSIDPFELSDEEIDILQALAERRTLLEQREGEVLRREAVLSAAETKIEEKIAQLEVLKQEIEALLAENEKRNDAQIQSLVQIYGAMKPKEAARIFETLEMDVLIDVVRNMKERKSAAILAKMNPRRAQALTLELAELNSLEQSVR